MSWETTLTRTEALAVRGDAAGGLAREAFDELVRAHQQRIYRVLLGLVHDSDAADTLTQECFLRAYRNRKGFRGESSVATWLVRIAVNLAMDHAKSRRNTFWRRLLDAPRVAEIGPAGPALEPLDPQASPERQFAAREELRAVWSVVNDLSPKQRAIFTLRFAEDMTLEEVAEVTALEVGTVKSHLARALSAVRKRLREKGVHASPSAR